MITLRHANVRGRADSLTIKQDALLHQLMLDANSEANLKTELARHYYVHVFDGELQGTGQVNTASNSANP
jgi:hypothetical protein